MSSHFGKLLLLVVFFSVSAAITVAQQSAGNINGRLSDGSGAVIPGVSVTLNSPAVQGEQKAITDEAGNYRFILLPPAAFTLTFELSGFKTLIREEVIVSVGKTTTINATLDVATQAETVTVTGESPVVDVTATTLVVNLDHTILKGVLGPRDQWIVLATIPGIRMTDVDIGNTVPRFGRATQILQPRIFRLGARYMF
ncbi:MAG: carboxypeptidase regulatory-like domain-containing protein [Acidobacteria bacterium]|nr:carboxypeptidase regulatory-like domain-containing protein [Acidobacteriota bacterium]